MTAVLIRIVLRYGAGILVTRGLMGADDAASLSTDPDVAMAIEVGIGAVIAGATEVWHLAARRFGWEH